MLIGSLVRGHWESKTACTGEEMSPGVLASLCNIAITVLRLEGETNLAEATRGTRNYQPPPSNLPA